MQIEKLRSLIREAVDNQLKEIEAVAEAAAMEARLAEYDKAMKTCESKIQAAENLEEVKELVDENKLNELKKKLKNLTKAKEKLEKQKAKKNKGKEVTTDAETDKEETVDETADAMDETYVEETYTMDEMENDNMKEEALNESFLKMQKLAGVITEGQYRKKVQILNEVEYAGIKKVPTSGDNYQLTIDAEKWSGQKGGGDHAIALFKNGTLYTTDGSWDWKAEPKSNEVKSLLKKYVEDNKIEKLSPDMSKLLG
jgi:alanyl-tRNA synthetase